MSLTTRLLALLILVSPASALALGKKPVVQPEPEREWTMLVFLNGNNDLDEYGFSDLNEMETVGSTDQINVVVQWASIRNGDTRRLLVKRDDDRDTVTSPIVERLGRKDMGSYQELVRFVEWGVERYPARKYFVVVWNHGGGWHRRLQGMLQDISWDDLSGNHITTEQFGGALKKIARRIGRPVDLLGNDACLMAMAEVGAELAPSVRVMVGSQDLEPSDGWPYDGLLNRWSAKPEATAAEVGAMLTEEFVKSYQGGTQGHDQVTLSTIDLGRQDSLHRAMAALRAEILTLGAADLERARAAARAAFRFDSEDYADLGDFLDLLAAQNVSALSPEVLHKARAAVSRAVLSNDFTPNFARAQGLAFWLPRSSADYRQYARRYRKMSFHRATGWADAVERLMR
ncbi:MAG: hypothetical protein IT285_07475 [Bdellovibrionales bacterium]|nr:hypothetical protein [Bdellovibrionales bacterium]